MRAPFLRTRARPNRVLDTVWTLIRRRKTGIMITDTAERLGLPRQTVKHILRRLCAEGILEREADIQMDGKPPAASYRLALDLGRRAPLLHGRQADGEGYRDMNIEAPQARKRDARIMPEGDEPHEVVRRTRMQLGLSQGELGQRLDPPVRADGVRRWETPPEHKRHEKISRKRLAQIAALRRS